MAVQRRLRAGDSELEAEIASLHAVTGALGEAVMQVRPAAVAGSSV